MEVRCSATIEECKKFMAESGKGYLKVIFKITDGPLKNFRVIEYVPQFQEQPDQIYQLSAMIDIPIISLENYPAQAEGWEGVIAVTDKVKDGTTHDTSAYVRLYVDWEHI